MFALDIQHPFNLSFYRMCCPFYFVFFAPHFPFYYFNGDLKASIFEWENIFGNLYIHKDPLYKKNNFLFCFILSYIIKVFSLLFCVFIIAYLYRFYKMAYCKNMLGGFCDIDRNFKREAKTFDFKAVVLI